MALPMRISGEPAYEPFGLLRRGFGLPSFEQLFSPEWWERETSWGVDIREDADHVYVEADLPGFRKEDVDVTIDNGMLSIRAEKREAPPEQRKGDYLLRERRHDRFERSFSLPSNVDPQAVNAKLQEGCLTITLNKTPAGKAKKIPLA